MQLDADDFHAGTELVKNFLQLSLGFVLDFAAVTGNNRLHFGLSDNFAQNRLCGDANRYVRAAHAKQIVFGVFDFPNYGKIDVDNVFVAGQHMAFGKGIKFAVRTVAAVAQTGQIGSVVGLGYAERNASFLRNAHFVDRFNRVGEMIMQAGVRRTVIGAEKQYDTLFAGLYLIKSRSQPDQQQDQHGPFDFELKAAVAAFAVNDFSKLTTLGLETVSSALPHGFTSSLLPQGP